MIFVIEEGLICTQLQCPLHLVMRYQSGKRKTEEGMNEVKEDKIYEYGESNRS